MSQRTRAYLYRIGLAVVPIVVGFGWITLEMSEQVIVLLAAVLAVGESGLMLAAANTPAKRPFVGESSSTE